MTSASRCNSTSSMTRSLQENLPFSTSSRAGYISSSLKLVRKPRLPMLMGRMGIPRGAATRAAASRVPSPPRTSKSCDSSATSRRSRPLGKLGKASAVSKSYKARIPRASSQRSKGGTTPSRSERRGREMIPMVWNSAGFCMSYGILLHALFSRVQKILLIAFGAGDAAGAGAKNLQSELYGCSADGGDGFVMQCRAGDDASGADIFARQLELRLYQDKEIGAGFGSGQRGGQNFADGNERYIEGEKIDGFRN